MENLNKLIISLETYVYNFGQDFLLPLAGIIIVIMIIWGGVQYIQGNAEGGKKTLIAAIIGLVIIAIASLIIREVAEIVAM